MTVEGAVAKVRSDAPCPKASRWWLRLNPKLPAYSLSIQAAAVLRREDTRGAHPVMVHLDASALEIYEGSLETVDLIGWR